VGANFLFLFDHARRDDIGPARIAAGDMGGIFNKLLRENTPIRRSDQALAAVVRCRPIEWEENDEGEQVPCTREWNGDYIDKKPSPGQVRECAARYTDDLVANFTGQTIVGLGKVPLEYMIGGARKIGSYAGTIFEHGEMVDCSNCGGDGKIAQAPYICRECGGRATIQCGECHRWAKHLKSCSAWGRDHDICPACDPPGSGKYPKRAKRCTECDEGRVPKDPDSPFICERLREGQLFFPTFGPAMLSKQPTQWVVIARDFERLPHLREELEYVEDTKYHVYPPVDADLEMDLDTLVSIDLETYGGFDPLEAETGIQCVAFTDAPGKGVAVDADDPRVPRVLSAKTIVGQNYNLYDRWWLHNKGFGGSLRSRIWDTRYAGKLLNPDTPNNLPYLTREFASPPIRGYWKTRNDYRDRKEEVGCIDVDATLRVYEGQRTALQNRGQLALMEDYIIPLSDVVFKMRCAGMKINKDRMDDASKIIKTDLIAGRDRLPDWSGTHTEAQHTEVQDFLYERLHLPVQKKRDSGKRTANAEALQELRSALETNHKSVKHLSDYEVDEALKFINNVSHLRELSKLESSFLRYKLSADAFVHPALNLAGTATLRMSCQDPNAQQVPNCKCTPKCYGTNSDCRGARFIFIPDEEDWEVMSVDLKQAEVIGFLWYVEEWKILERILHGGFDAHEMVAEACGLERSQAKNTTFALLYGEHPRTTAARLHQSVEDIEGVREIYFAALPGVKEYRSRMVYSAMSQGYVQSPFGVRRYVRVEREVGRAANQACNMPIQNIPPMVIGKAMIKIDKELPEPARMWMQVHDELIIVYPKHLRKQVQDCVVANMRVPVSEMQAAPLGMAGGLVFNVDVEIGTHWGNLREVA